MIEEQIEFSNLQTGKTGLSKFRWKIVIQPVIQYSPIKIMKSEVGFFHGHQLLHDKMLYPQLNFVLSRIIGT